MSPSKKPKTSQKNAFEPSRALYEQANPEHNRYRATPGLTEALVREISAQKKEPAWMLKKRLQAFALYQNKPLPTWGPDLSGLNLDEIVYFVRPDTEEAVAWNKVPEDIKKTFDRLGIPEAEKTALSGVGAQYDSDVVYHNLKKEWESKGVIFENMDVAVQKYPELVKKYFMTQCVPINDHKFVMLHAAVWSGGTFIYVPKNVTIDLPLQAYFRMNAEGGGQFEHTLIIADVGSKLHYIEGCSAPRYNKSALHAGCVEIFVHAGARVRYSSIENWSKNTYNLNTKRALVDADAVIEWVNGNMGCLTEEARVFTTTRGRVSIKDIKKGEKIYSWDDQTNRFLETTVRAQIVSGDKPVFQVHAGGREIEASANHPFLTLERTRRNPEHKKSFFTHVWKPLEQLRCGDVIALTKKIPLYNRAPYTIIPPKVADSVPSCNQYQSFSIPTKQLYNDITIPNETSADLMWLAGLLIGDGHIDVQQNKINLATHVTEDYREEVCAVLKKLFKYTVTEKKERYIIINSKILCLLFTELGFGGNADTKQLPSWIFQLPEDQILAFLAGYFDADGHVGEYCLAYTSINKPLLEDVKYLSMSLGFGVSHIMKHRDEGEAIILRNTCHASVSWRLLLNGKEVLKLPIRCARKRNKALAINFRRDYTSAGGLNFKSKTNSEVGFARITEIIPLGVRPTYDIEVEKHHNFISNGLIVHNSGTTMLYPSSILRGQGARADSLGIAFAGPGQHQDTGAKAIHAAPNTSSTIVSKSISVNGGINTFRGLIHVTPVAKNTTASMVCDALLIGSKAIANTIPELKIKNEQVNVAHEARVGKIGEQEIFYLQSRGFSEDEAIKLVVSGFISPIVKSLPVEYALELNKLIELEMEGAVG